MEKSRGLQGGRGANGAKHRGNAGVILQVLAEDQTQRRQKERDLWHLMVI